MFYGNKLKFLREEKEISQYEVSSLLHLNKRVYGQYEREYVVIPLKHLITLCNYFDVSLDYIFDFTNIRQYKDINKDLNLTNVGNNLKTFRKNKKLTQVKISEILNIDQPTWSIYEKGKKLIGLPFLYTICKKYKISADYLLGRTNSPDLSL